MSRKSCFKNCLSDCVCRGVILSVFAGVMVLLCPGDTSAGDTLSPEAYRRLNPDVPFDFQPVLKGPTPQEVDSLAAERFFARARMFEQNDKSSEALRFHERAWRYSPHETILSQIVSLTAQLNRPDEMARYFAKMRHPEKLDVLVLRNVGLLLTASEDFEHAVRAYEAAMQSLAIGAYPSIRIALRHELGRLYYLTENYEKAAECLDLVLRSIREPKRFGLDEEILQALAEDQFLSRQLLVDCYLLLEKPNEAEKALREAIQEAEKKVAERKSEEVKKTEGAEKESAEKEGAEKESAEKEDAEIENLEALVLPEEFLGAKADFALARIAFLQKRYPEALETLKKALDAKLRGEDDAPYTLCESLFQTLNREAELIPTLEKIYLVDTDNAALGYFLAELYLKSARSENDVEKRTAAQTRAEELLTLWTEKKPQLTGYVGLAELAMRQEKPEKLLHVLFQLFSQHEDEDAVVAMLQMLEERMFPDAQKEKMEMAAPKEKPVEDKASVPAEDKASKPVEDKASVPAEDKASVPAEDKASASVEDKASKPAEDKASKPVEDKASVRTAELVDSPLLPFLSKTVEFAEGGYHAMNAKIPWQFFWGIAFLAKETDKAELSDRFYQSAQNILVRKTFPENHIPSATFFTERADDLVVQKRYDEALNVLRLGLQTVSPTGEAVEYLRYYLTNVLLLKEEYAQAVQEIEQAMEGRDDSILLSQQLGQALFLAGDLERAATVYRDVLKKHQDKYDSTLLRQLLRDTRLSLSSLESSRGNVEPAEELLEQTLDEVPDDAGAKNDLAYLWSTQKKNLHRAILMSQEALQEEPENYAYLDTLGWIYFQIGELEQAKKYLTKALEKETDPVACSHFGDVYLALKDPESAKKYFTQALEEFQKSMKEKQLVDENEYKHTEERLRQLTNP